MRLLFITYRLPIDLCSGDQSTLHHMVKHFAKNHEISLLAFVSSAEKAGQLDAVDPYCQQVDLVILSKWQSLRNCVMRSFSSDPLQVGYYRSREMFAKVQQVIQQEKIDVAYAYHLRSGQYLAGLQSCPRVLDLKPVQTLNLKRMKDHVSNPLKRFLYKNEYKRVRRYEPRLVSAFDRCLVISEKDRNAVDPNHRLTNIRVNPHGLDPEFFAPDPSRDPEPGSLIFTGKMNYDPNVDAAVYFCEEVFPLVKQKVPHARLYIVGIDPKPEVAALAKDPSVIVTGYVNDMRPHMNRAQVAIDPMRIGAGLQNKVLENMSMGVPMVITSVANEGIQAIDGQHVLIADSALEFAERTVGLLQDERRRGQISEAARQFITQNWTWEKHFDDLEQLFYELAEKRHAVKNEFSAAAGKF